MACITRETAGSTLEIYTPARAALAGVWEVGWGWCVQVARMAHCAKSQQRDYGLCCRYRVICRRLAWVNGRFEPLFALALSPQL